MFKEAVTFRLNSRKRSTVYDLIEDNIVSSLKDSNESVKRERNVVAAIVWQRMSNGYRIISLEEDRFMEAINFIRVHRRKKFIICFHNLFGMLIIKALNVIGEKDFFVEEPMSLAIDMSNDLISMRTSIKMIYKKLLERQSYCAVQEGENKIVGVVVASINFMGDHVRTETRIRVNEGEGIFNIMSLRSCVFSKARPYEVLNIDNYFRIHMLFVHVDHRRGGIGTALINCCVERARTLLTPACIAGLSSIISQNMARKLGFNLLAEVHYKDFKLYNDETKSFVCPFEYSTDKNKSLACMALSIALPSQSFVTIDVDDRKRRKKKS